MLLEAVRVFPIKCCVHVLHTEHEAIRFIVIKDPGPPAVKGASGKLQPETDADGRGNNVLFRIRFALHGTV